MAIFLGAERFFVAFESFGKAFQAIEQTAFIEVGDGHGFVGGDGAVVAGDSLVQLAEPFQGSPFFDEGLGMILIECEHFIEATDGFLVFIEIQEGLSFAEQEGDFRGIGAFGRRGVRGTVFNTGFGGVLKLEDAFFELIERAEEALIGLIGGANGYAAGITHAEGGQGRRSRKSGESAGNFGQLIHGAPLEIGGEKHGDATEPAEDAGDDEHDFVVALDGVEFLGALGGDVLLDAIEAAVHGLGAARSCGVRLALVAFDGELGGAKLFLQAQHTAEGFLGVGVLHAGGQGAVEVGLGAKTAGCQDENEEAKVKEPSGATFRFHK